MSDIQRYAPDLTEQKIVFILSMFMNCMLLAVIGKYDGLKNPLRMLLLNLASVDLVATTLGLKQVKYYFLT